SFEFTEEIKTDQERKKNKEKQTPELKARKKLLSEAINEAFSEEGLEKLAKKNNNKPIWTVTVMDGKLEDKHKDNLFGNKYVENDQLACFVIYEDLHSKNRKIFKSISAYV